MSIKRTNAKSPYNELISKIYRLEKRALYLPSPLTFYFPNSNNLGITSNYIIIYIYKLSTYFLVTFGLPSFVF